jgi:hypothetical protein
VAGEHSAWTGTQQRRGRTCPQVELPIPGYEHPSGVRDEPAFVDELLESALAEPTAQLRYPVGAVQAWR